MEMLIHCGLDCRLQMKHLRGLELPSDWKSITKKTNVRLRLKAALVILNVGNKQLSAFVGLRQKLRRWPWRMQSVGWIQPKLPHGWKLFRFIWSAVGRSWLQEPCLLGSGLKWQVDPGKRSVFRLLQLWNARDKHTHAAALCGNCLYWPCFMFCQSRIAIPVKKIAFHSPCFLF